MVVVAVAAWTMEDMGTSQLRNVVAGFRLKSVSLERRASRTLEGCVVFVAEVLMIKMLDGVGALRSKEGLDVPARRAEEVLFMTSTRPFFPHTMRSFSVKVLGRRGAGTAATETTLANKRLKIMTEDGIVAVEMMN